VDPSADFYPASLKRGSATEQTAGARSNEGIAWRIGEPEEMEGEEGLRRMMSRAVSSNKAGGAMGVLDRQFAWGKPGGILL